MTHWMEEPTPTHVCDVCGALWSFLHPRDTGFNDAWLLRTSSSDECCSEVEKSENVRPVLLSELATWINMRLEADSELYEKHGPKPTDTIN